MRRVTAHLLIGVVCVLVCLGELAAQSPVSEVSYSAAINSALEARQRGAFDEAEKAFRVALERRPGDIEATRLLALMIAFQDRLDEARDVIESAYADDPENIDVQLSRARIFGWSERFPDVERMVDGILDVEPDYADAWALKGRLAYYQQAYDRAAAAFARAESLAPED